jgi:NAD-dependent DNA ligase
VIITGTIPGHDRKAAGALLENAGATIAKSLNKSIELVILGTNPGPDKLKKIEDMGIATISWKELANELGLADEGKSSRHFHLCSY